MILTYGKSCITLKGEQITPEEFTRRMAEYQKTGKYTPK